MIFESWAKLKKDQQLCCIDKTPLHQKIGGKQVWRPTGCLLEHWDNKIEETVTEILEAEENQALLRDSKGLGYTCSAVLLMLSDNNRDNAKPFVVCFHEEKKKAEDAVKLLRNHRQLRPFDFSYFGVKGLFTLTGDQPSTGSFADHGPWYNNRVYGKHILACTVPINEYTKGRRATMGGILKFGPQIYYGLTSAHILFEPDVRKSDSESSEQDAAASVSTLGRFRDPNAESKAHAEHIIPENPIFHSFFSLNDALSENRQERQQGLAVANEHIGNCVTGDARFCERSLDWALFEITNPRFWGSNTFELPDGNSSAPRPGYNSFKAPRGDLILHNGPTGFKKGVGIGIKASLSLPWLGKFVRAWLLTCPLGEWR